MRLPPSSAAAASPPPLHAISSFPQSMKILEKMAANKKKHEEAAARAEQAAAAAQEEDSGDEGALHCLFSQLGAGGEGQKARCAKHAAAQRCAAVLQAFWFGLRVAGACPPSSTRGRGRPLTPRPATSRTHKRRPPPPCQQKRSGSTRRSSKACSRLRSRCSCL